MCVCVCVCVCLFVCVRDDMQGPRTDALSEGTGFSAFADPADEFETVNAHSAPSSSPSSLLSDSIYSFSFDPTFSSLSSETSTPATEAPTSTADPTAYAKMYQQIMGDSMDSGRAVQGDEHAAAPSEERSTWMSVLMFIIELLL